MDTAIYGFHITNMHCADCALLLEETVRALPGLLNALASIATNEIHVRLDTRRTSPDTVTAAITELGFRLKQASTRAPADFVAFQVSDAAWQALAPLLRDAKPPARVRDDREMFEAIAYKHRHAVPWRDVPVAFGPWQTVYARFRRWRTDGTWARVTAAARDTAFADELGWVESAGE